MDNDTLEDLKALWVIISPIFAIAVSLGIFIMKRALKELEDLKSSKASTEALRELVNAMQELDRSLEKFQDKVTSGYASNDHVNIIENDLRRVQSDVSRIDSDLIRHLDTAMERLRTDFAERLKLATELMRKE